MQRSISMPALFLTSISAIIGSGWLFAAYYTASIAGPSTIIAWIIGGFAVMVIAFVFAELSAMLPVMGTISRIPQYTHGTIVSFAFCWITWLSYVALMATEVQAVVQYLNYYFPSLVYPHGGLTDDGYLLAFFLLLVTTVINIFSLRWLIRCNSILTLLKIIIPLFVSIALLALFFSPHKVLHANHSAFMPFGIKGMLAAISTGGIVFAFNGFRQASEMAGEAKRPGRALPIAVVGSISVCLIIYLLLQLAFLSCLTPTNLAHGWHHINITGATSPFAGILNQSKQTWMMPILYIGAIIGPLAAALMYTASAGRSLFAMSKNDYMPLMFQKISGKGIPWLAIIISLAAGMCMFAPLPGWDKMISFLASLMAISYASAPICFITLRKQLPEQKRPLKLPFAKTWAVVAFYFCNLLTYWSGWNIISKLAIALIIGYAILLIYHFCTKRGREITLNFRESLWLWPYFIGTIIISYLGSFGHGIGVITFGWDFLVIGLFSLLITWLAASICLPAQITKNYISELKIPHQNEIMPNPEK